MGVFIGLIALGVCRMVEAYSSSSQTTIKVGGMLAYSSSVSLKAKAAFDLWASWTKANNATLGWYAEITWIDWDGVADLASSVSNLISDGAQVLIPPYTTGHTKTFVDAVPSHSNIPILVWGGATDSIFTNNCLDQACFGGLSVASDYVPASLEACHTKAGAAISVGLIQNNNGFSASVTAGAKTYIGSTAGLTLVGKVTLEAYKSTLTNRDIQEITTLMSRQPDVVVIVGHPGDVEQEITVARSGSYKPKAIIALNAFTSPSNYANSDSMTDVIMPTQWDEHATRKDSIVQWTSSDFKAALGDNASYHSASAGALAVALTHAIEGITDGNYTPANLVVQMSNLPQTDTFYASMSWVSGILQKPMYGLQKQASGDVIVAPTGPIVYPMVGKNMLVSSTVRISEWPILFMALVMAWANASTFRRR